MDVLAYEPAQVLFVHRWSATENVVLLLHFGPTQTTITLPLPVGEWRKLLDLTDPQWQGEGSTLPEVLTSGGEASLSLLPVTCVLSIRQKEKP